MTSKGEWCGVCLQCGHEYWDIDTRPAALCYEDHERVGHCLCAAIDKHREVCNGQYGGMIYSNQ